MIDKNQFVATFKHQYRNNYRNKKAVKVTEKELHQLALKAWEKNQIDSMLKEERAKPVALNNGSRILQDQTKEDIIWNPEIVDDGITILENPDYPKIDRFRYETNANGKTLKFEKSKETIDREQFRSDHQIYMRSKNWQQVKNQYRADSSRYQNCWKCAVEPGKAIIQFHHLHYKNFKNETLDDIIPLCEPCHKEVHHKYNTQKIKLNGPPKKSLREMTLLLCESTLTERKNFKQI